MTYEYVCTSCGHEWEAEQSISAAPLKTCPKCNADQAKRQVSGGQGFILKGGGWYADGYGTKKGSSASTTSSSSTSSSSTSSSGSSGDSTGSSSTGSSGSGTGKSGSSGGGAGSSGGGSAGGSSGGGKSESKSATV